MARNPFLSRVNLIRGRNITLMSYLALAAHGIATGGSGFLFLFALQLDLVSMIVLYSSRPLAMRRHGQPSAITVLTASVPLIIINYMFAQALGSALGEYPRKGGNMLERPSAVWGDAMIALAIAYLVAIALDRFLFRRDKLFWQELVGSMMRKGTVLMLMGYVGFGLLLWLGEENSEWMIPCLALARIALEYVLKPDLEKVVD